MEFLRRLSGGLCQDKTAKVYTARGTHATLHDIILDSLRYFQDGVGIEYTRLVLGKEWSTLFL